MALKIEKRFKNLRFVAGLYPVMAVLVLIGSGVLAFFALIAVGTAANPGSALMGAIGIAGGGLAIAVSLFAAGEGIDVVLAIEENTRLTAMIHVAQNSPAREVVDAAD